MTTTAIGALVFGILLVLAAIGFGWFKAYKRPQFIRNRRGTYNSLNWLEWIVFVVLLIWGLLTIVGAFLLPASADGKPTLVANFSYAADGLKVTFDAHASSVTKGKINGYTWDFGDGKNGTGVTASDTYSKAGTYDVTLEVSEANTGKSARVTEKVTVTKASAGSGTTKPVALEDPGPGNCLPGPAILANLRKQKPGGQDFKSPYSTYELKTLSGAEINWIAQNESKPCVIALAGSYGVAAKDLPVYIQHHLLLKEVGPGGLTVQNSYFAPGDGHIVWWQVQTFPQGELVWFDHYGVPQMKFVCGNRLRKVTTTSGKPPVTKTTVTTPTKPCAPNLRTKPTNGPSVWVVSICNWYKTPQTFNQMQNGALGDQSVSDNHNGVNTSKTPGTTTRPSKGATGNTNTIPTSNGTATGGGTGSAASGGSSDSSGSSGGTGATNDPVNTGQGGSGSTGSGTNTGGGSSGGGVVDPN